MEHKLEYISKDDLKKILNGYKKEICQLTEEISKLKSSISLWQGIAFFSWILTIVSLAISILKPSF